MLLLRHFCWRDHQTPKQNYFHQTLRWKLWGGITVAKQMVTLVSEMFWNKNASEKCAHIKSKGISDTVKCVFLGADRHNVSRITWYLYMKGKHWRWSVGKRTVAPPSYITELALHLVASDKLPVLGYLQFLLRSWNRQTDTDPHWQSSFLGLRWGWKTKRRQVH